MNEDDQVCCRCTDHLQKDTFNEPINLNFPITDYTNRIQECPIDPEEATAHYRNTIRYLLSEQPELLVGDGVTYHMVSIWEEWPGIINRVYNSIRVGYNGSHQLIWDHCSPHTHTYLVHGKLVVGGINCFIGQN